MKFRTLRYYLGEAASSLVRNRLMSVASILTVASCIFIVSVFYSVAANVDFFLRQMESSISVLVYVREDLSAADVQRLNDRILSIPHVLSVVYRTSQEAREEFAVTLPDPRILEGITGDDVFRRSFDVTVDDLRNQAAVVDALEGLHEMGADTIRHSQELANVTRTVSNVLRVVCFVLIAILGVISVVIIFNTIRITVNARKTEINIMKYVGATDWFIRWPFVLEGMLIGIAGGLLPVIVCWISYDGVLDLARDGLAWIGFVQFRSSVDIFIYLLPFDLLLGMLIGIIGSMFSVRKHLKV